MVSVFIHKIFNRSNIFIECNKKGPMSAKTHLSWYMDELKEHGRNAPKALIFVRYV